MESSDKTDNLPELEAVVQSGDFDLSEVITFDREKIGDTTKVTDTTNVPLVNSADTKQSFEERAL